MIRSCGDIVAALVADNKGTDSIHVALLPCYTPAMESHRRATVHGADSFGESSVSEPPVTAPRGFWGSLERPISALAPMEDVTDTVFRRIVANVGGPDVFFTEFVNTDGMCSEGRDAVIHRLRYTDIERPLVAQVWGIRPEHFLDAAGQIREMGFDGIDINMGCPVKKITRSGSCSALIDNPTLAGEIVLATREGAGDLPVSIKTRLGFRYRKTEEWAVFLLALAPDVLTMHGRIAKDMSEVPADWNEIARVATIRNQMGSSTLVIGNGDVVSAEQMMALPRAHGVDGVMVGRGVFQNLFLFRAFRRLREAAGGQMGTTPRSSGWNNGADRIEDFALLPPDVKLEHLFEHATLYRRTWGDTHNFNVLKKFVKIYVSGFEGAAKLRAALMETSSYDELLETIGELLRDLRNG